jgi:phenylacetate-CoA ligase
VTGFLGRIRGTFVILRTFRGQRRVPFLSPEQLHELRDARVRELVRYAAEYVPHYRDLFGEIGIDPREIRSAEDLASLPLLEKRQVQERPERFRAQSPLGTDGMSMRTAGRTGTPLEVFRDTRSLLANISYAERERDVETRFCGSRYRYAVAQLANPAGNLFRVRDHYARTSFRPLRPRLHRLSIADRLDRVVDELNRVRPACVRGLGSHLELLFRTVAARGIPVHQPKVLVYGGDHMSADCRRLIEERFGVPVLTRYSATEAMSIGWFCEERTGFHLNEDLTHVSIVTPDGRTAAPGERGEVVVTDLVNRGSVLLNYRLGDLATISPERCSCGRGLRLMNALEGRVSEIIELADGTLVHPALIESVAIESNGILRFQVAQVERDRFEVRLVTADQATYERAAERVMSDLRGLLRGAAIHAERRTELAPEPGGKFASIVALPRSGHQ